MDNWEALLLISAALKTGLLQSVAQKKQTAEELASATNAYDLRATEIVMEALRELGLVGRDRSHYELRPAAAPYVDEKNPDFMGNALLHASRRIENWTKLDKAIKTGKSQSRRRSPEELAIFVKAMDEFSRERADEVVDLLKKEHPKSKNVLDLGGALGTYSKLFEAKGLEVTLVDTSAVIELAKKELAGSSIKLKAVDFNQKLPKGPFDIILLSNITHIYKPDKLEHLFQRVGESLSKDGVVGIVDWIRDKSRGASMFAVNMLIHTAGGGTWTLPQYELWLREAGLRLSSMKSLKESEQKLLIAKKIDSRYFMSS